MLVEYGNIKADIKGFKWPTEDLFNAWKEDFFKLKDVQNFQIYLHGRFLSHLKYGARTQDIDVLLLGNQEDEKTIERVLYEGIKLAIEKYEIFVDLLWVDKVYPKDFPENKGQIINYIIGDKFIIDGKTKKTFHGAKQLRDGLWKIVRKLPTMKMVKQFENGTYYVPELIWDPKQNNEDAPSEVNFSQN